MADTYGKWKVTFRDGKGRETALELVDRKSEVRDQAAFFSPSYGKVIRVEAATR